MKCVHCGNEINPGHKFCEHCGAEQPQQGASYEQGTTPPPFSSVYNSNGTGTVSGGNNMILTVFSIICAAIYGIGAIVRGFRLLGNVFSGYYFNMRVSSIFILLFEVLSAIVGIWMCFILIMIAFRRTKENTDGLLLCLGGGGIASVVVRLLRIMVLSVLWGYSFVIGNVVGSFLLTIVGAVVTVGGVYLILRFLLGENPILGKTTQELQSELRFTLLNLGNTVGEMSAKKENAASDQNQNVQGDSMAWNGGQAPNGQVPPPPGGSALFRLKTDRSLLLYIVLNIVTCGIYSLYFIYALARDINVVCAGDGRSTGGLLKFILLSIITCGIYSWIWYYGVGNRLAANAPRYGMSFQENGTTILLWELFGVLLCGIGPFIAMHIVIKNTNMLCGAYNHMHNM